LPELILFDLDETLFDDAYARRRGLATVRRLDAALAGHSLDWLVDQYGRLLNATHRIEVEQGVDLLTSRRERFRRLGAMCGRSWSERRIDTLVARYREAYTTGARAIRGSAPLLDQLAAHAQVGVVTNNRVQEQEAKLEAIGLRDRIDFLVTSEDVGFWKPDRRIFDIALKRAAVTAEQAVMIGDSWEYDVLGAMAAGIRPVWFDRYGRRVPASPDPVTVVRSYVPLAPVLRALRAPR
jgi:HAD superfamily hydrolase (TIGR01549 family)